MVQKLIIVMITAMVPFAVACSDKATSGTVSVEGKPYVRAFTTNLVDHGIGEVELNRTQAACVAAKWVNIFQPARLDAAGVTASQLRRAGGLDNKVARVALSDTEITKLVEAFGDCAVDLREAYINSITVGATVSETDRACLSDAFSSQLIDDMMALQITKGTKAVDDDPKMAAEVFAALSSCPGAIDLGS